MLNHKIIMRCECTRTRTPTQPQVRSVFKNNERKSAEIICHWIWGVRKFHEKNEEKEIEKEKEKQENTFCICESREMVVCLVFAYRISTLRWQNQNYGLWSAYWSVWSWSCTQSIFIFYLIWVVMRMPLMVKLVHTGVIQNQVTLNKCENVSNYWSRIIWIEIHDFMEFEIKFGEILNHKRMKMWQMCGTLRIG